MSINLIKNKKLNLNIPEFVCDDNLNKNLQKYEMLSHLNTYCYTIVCGRPGMGKTSFVISLFDKKSKIFYKMFHNVFLVMPSISRNSMKKNIFKKHDESKMWDELNFSTLSDIKNQLTESTEDNKSSILILDDVGATLKNGEIAKLLREIIYNRRHFKCQIIMMVQSIISVPLEIRKMSNNYVLFKPSKMEFENIMNEVLHMNKDTALELLNYAYIDPHDYLFINEPTQKIYKDFDEIIIKSKT